jgi:DNA-directed RNA polymerase subunit B
MSDEKKSYVKISDNAGVQEEYFKSISHLDIHKSKRGILVLNAIESFDDVIDNALPEIITKNFTIVDQVQNERKTGDAEHIKSYKLNVIFSNVKVNNPFLHNHERKSENDSLTKPLYPTQALNMRHSYSGNLHVDAEVIITAISMDGKETIRKDSLQKLKLAPIPIMVGSKYCNTYGFSREALRALGEDFSQSRGGHFIYNGGEWTVPIKESSSRFNIPRVYKTDGDNEMMKLSIICKFGNSYENSKQIDMIVDKDHKISIIFFSDSNLKLIKFPFFLIFRLLGCNTDKEIFDYILQRDVGTPVNPVALDKNHEKLKEIIVKAMLSTDYGIRNNTFPKHTINARSVNEALYLIIKYTQSTKTLFANQDFDANEEYKRNAFKAILTKIDDEFLIHIGKEPSDRNEKKKELGSLIRKLLYCYIGIDKLTDRDSGVIKSYQTVGDLFSQTLKTIYNKTVVSAIKENFKKAFINNSFESISIIPTLKQSISSEIGKHIMSSIIRSDGQIRITRNTSIKKRMSSVRDDSYSPLKSVSLRRAIENPLSGANATGSERSKEMRRPHPSTIGFNCDIHSSVGGPKIGITKNMALNANITIRNVQSTVVLIDIIKNYKDFIPYKKFQTSTDMYQAVNLGVVRLNGIPLAYTNNIPKTIYEFTKKRRNNEINSKTSIEWPVHNPKDLLFSTDQGRFYRPLVIVYNNVRDYEYLGEKSPSDYKNFRQGTQFTLEMYHDILKGKITYEDLFKRKIIEYITAQEQVRMLIASDFAKLKENEGNPLIQYTHLEIPISTMAITTLTSPLANYSSFTKWVYQISQQKQAADIPVHNYAHRNDSKTFLAFGRETTLVNVSVEKYVRIGVVNLMQAIGIYTGYNQDDSSIVNRSIGDCLKYNGHLFDVDVEELETQELIMKPDPSITKEMKSCNYSKLGPDGIITRGSIVTKGDIIIGKVKPVTKDEKMKQSNYKYSDLSRDYTLDFPSIVYDIKRDKNEDKKEFIKICYLIMLPVDEGSKLSSRHGQKGIVSLNLSSRDMLFTQSGLIPHIIMNPHSFPKRMTMGQFYECLLGKLAIAKGITCTADPFTIIDDKMVREEMKKLGLAYSCTEKMFNGWTGKPMDTEIFLGPVSFKLGQGFAQSIMYATEIPRVDQITGQPLSGKASAGGLKISELNQNVLFAHGSGKVFAQKFFEDSDDYCVYICACGRHAIVNTEAPIYKCLVCKGNAQIYAVDSCKASHVFMKELAALHIDVKLEVR